MHGTNPAHSDTDGDWIPDGTEIADGTDPLDPSDFKTIVYFVDPDASGLGDGLSWDNAFNMIAAANEIVVPGDMIMIAAGVYPATKSECAAMRDLWHELTA